MAKKNEKTVDKDDMKATETVENIEETENAECADCTECTEASETDALKAELADTKDKLLRKVAEFDNYKKRTAKEKSENFAMGVCGAIEKLLPVLDNFDRAIDSAENDGESNAFLDGIKMIRKQFCDALSEIGISEIESVGAEFNPEKHNAVMMEDSDEYKSGTVTSEFAKGYIYKSGDTERVVRHSMVKVAN